MHVVEAGSTEVPRVAHEVLLDLIRPNAGYACLTARRRRRPREDAEVPANADGQWENGPYVMLETLSWPTMSGFMRPSMVGPCELYGSSCLDCQQSAPTASAAGEDAGAAMLPGGDLVLERGLQLTRSSCGDVETLYPRIAQNTSRS